MAINYCKKTVFIYFMILFFDDQAVERLLVEIKLAEVLRC